MIGKILGGFSRHWKTLAAFSQALEKRASGQAARSRDVQERQSGALSKLCGRSDRTACALFLSGGPCGVAARLAVRSAATAFLLFARAPTRSPPKAGGKSAAERREVGERSENGRRAEARRSSRGPFPPSRNASARQAGPRDRRGRPSPRRKLSERPASEAQPARPSAVLAPSRVQRRGVEARRAARALRGRRGAGAPSRGNFPSGASAPRGRSLRPFTCRVSWHTQDRKRFG